MATSGQVSTNTTYDSYFWVRWNTLSQDVASNKTKIEWSCGVYCGHNFYNNAIKMSSFTINGTRVYGGGTYSNFLRGDHQIAYGTLDITHKDDGKQTLCISSFTGWLYSNHNYSSSVEYYDLTPIPRQASILTAPDFNDEENPTITFSNPAGSAASIAVCISFTGARDDITYRAPEDGATSYTFNLKPEEREILRSGTTTSNSRTVKFYVRTYIGGVYYYSMLDRTLTIVNANPVFSSDNLSYEDTNQSIINITNDPSIIVRNKSNLTITYTPATPQKGATISKYVFTLNGVTRASTLDGGSVNFGLVNNIYNPTLSAVAIDSRGNSSTTVYKSINCFDYYTPSLSSFNAYRANEDGKENVNGVYLCCKYDKDYASVGDTNSVKLTIHYNGNTQDITNGTNLIDLNGDTETTYQVYLSIEDSYGGRSVSPTITVFGRSRILNITPDGTGIAIGKTAEENELFDCRWDANFNKGLTVNGTSAFNNTVNVQGSANIEGAANAKGGLYVTGEIDETDWNRSLFVSGNTYLDGNVGMEGKVTVEGDLSVSGTVTFNSMGTNIDGICIKAFRADFNEIVIEPKKSLSSTSRQSILMFGYNGGTLINGVIGLGGGKSPQWSGQGNVTITMLNNGYCVINLPQDATDTFTFISGEEFEIIG